VVATNGLFTVLVDFGPGVFTGETNWLEIGVETNGTTLVTTLTPRQQLTPVPYAIYAETAGNLSVPLSASQLTSIGNTNIGRLWQLLYWRLGQSSRKGQGRRDSSSEGAERFARPTFKRTGSNV
jgi:hypothetical protein